MWCEVAENRRIADSFVSSVIDEYFVGIEVSRTWFQAAEELGFHALSASAERETFRGLQNEDIIREFFVHLQGCEDPGETSEKFKGRGWRAVPLEDTDNGATRLWKERCDDFATPEGRGSSIKIAELDLSKTLGVDVTEPWHRVKFFSQLTGRRLFAKFQFQVGRDRQAYVCGADIPTNFGRFSSGVSSENEKG